MASSLSGGIGVVLNGGEEQGTVKTGVQGWDLYFGERDGARVVTPYSAHPKETLSLPEVYKGSCPYLTNVLITIIEEQEEIPTKILLPIRTTENETSITWDEFVFNNTLLGPVPEEGISRLVTQQLNERRTHYTRSGLAFMIQHGFMKTPKGRMSYQMNLRQIRNAIIESLYIGVLEALLRSKTNAQVFNQCFGKSLTYATARKAMDMEVESWAEIQKTDYGWDMLNSRAHKTLKINGVTPDAWVVDEGVKKYVAGVRRENWAYFIKGPEGPKMYAEQLANGNPTSLDAAAGTLIFEAKSFNIPNVDDPVNVLSRRRSIGEYVVSFPHVEYTESRKYASTFRDILVYDESRDGFKKISIMDGLNSCCRFDNLGHLKWPRGFGGDNRPQHDMFMGDDGAAIEFLGQMTEDDMPFDAIRDWTLSVTAGLDATIQTGHDLNIMMKMVTQLEDAPVAMTSVDKAYFRYVAYAHTVVDSDLIDSQTGMMRLPCCQEDFNGLPDAVYTAPLPSDLGGLMFGANGEACFYPYGFGNQAGIEELANVKYKTAFPTLHVDAVMAVRGFKALVARLETVCQDNLLIRQRSAPYFYRKKTEAAIFANLVHRPMPPLLCTTVTTLVPPIANRSIEASGLIPESEIGGNLDAFFSAQLSPNKLLHKDYHLEDESIKDILRPVLEVLNRAFQLISPAHVTYLVQLIVDEVKGTGGSPQPGELSGQQRLTTVFTAITKHLAHLNQYQLLFALSEDLSLDAKNKALPFSKLVTNIQVTNIRATSGFTTLGDKPQKELEKGDTVTQLTCSPALDNIIKDDLDINIIIKCATNDAASSSMMQNEEDLESDDMVYGRFNVKQNKRKLAVAETRGIYKKWKWEPTQKQCDVIERAESASKKWSSPLHVAVCKALMGVPVTKDALGRFIEANVTFPFNVVYARPYMTYDMSSGVCMKSGADTGETLIGHADFQLADNVVQKYHYGNFTFHSKSVVYRQQNVYLAEDMFATGYVGGNDTTFFTTNEQYNDYKMGKRSFRSIFAMLAPYSSMEYPNPLDLTGSFGGRWTALDKDAAEDGRANGGHFPTSSFYTALWGWSHEDAMEEKAEAFTESLNLNTVVFQGHQALYNPHNSLFDLVVKNTGHWGDRVYPGCGKIRSGMAKALESVYYNNIYGGGGNLQGILK